MATHLDVNDAAYREAAAAILRRHDNFEAEANITTAVRDFLILTGLADGDEIVEENPPSDGSRRAVDLTALDTFIEFKRRVGTAGGGFNPDPAHVAQLDDYLELSKADGKGVRTGILTDGRHWLLRWPGAGPIRDGGALRVRAGIGGAVVSPVRVAARPGAAVAGQHTRRPGQRGAVPGAGQPRLPAGY